MRTALASIIAVSLITHGGAARAYMAVGVGTSNCEDWTSARRLPGATSDYQQWLLGFLSGIGFVGNNGDDPLDGTNAAGVLGWVDNYCRAHPIAELVDAAEAFYRAHPHR